MSLVASSSRSENALSESSQSVYVRPQRSIGGIVMDVTIDESHTDELEITEHPVEHGASVSDHAYIKPASLTIRAGASDASAKATAGDKRSVAIYEALRKLQGSREPFDVVTGKRVYRNMLIASLSVVTDQETENVLLVTAELREILIVKVRTVSVPRSRQRLAAKTAPVADKGQVQTEPKRSGLSQLFGRS